MSRAFVNLRGGAWAPWSLQVKRGSGKGKPGHLGAGWYSSPRGALPDSTTRIALPNRRFGHRTGWAQHLVVTQVDDDELVSPIASGSIGGLASQVPGQLVRRCVDAPRPNALAHLLDGVAQIPPVIQLLALRCKTTGSVGSGAFEVGQVPSNGLGDALLHLHGWHEAEGCSKG